MTKENGFSKLLGNEEYEKMLKSCQLCYDKGGRLKKTFEKDKVKIAFIGGSVTYGWRENDNSTEGNFPQLCGEYFREKNPQKEIEILNCGISGTRCLMGICVTDIQLRAFSPDIVVIEYAINELMNSEGAAQAEGLIRQALCLESCPAVVVLSVFCRDGYSCEEMFSELSQHYGIAMCGLKAGVYPYICDNRLPWEIYSNDKGHPTLQGHRLIADCLCNLLEHNLTEDTQVFHLPKALISGEYENMRCISSDMIEGGFEMREEKLFLFEKGLFNTADGSHRIEFSARCRKIAAVFIQDGRTGWGNTKVVADGVEIEGLQGYSIFGWHNPVAKMLIDKEECAFHKIKIEMEKDDEKKDFCLLAILVG